MAEKCQHQAAVMDFRNVLVCWTLLKFGQLQDDLGTPERHRHFIDS